MPEFAEAVMYRPLAEEARAEGIRYRPGIFLGVREKSDELIFLDGEEVVRARDYRRRMPADRWQVDALAAMTVMSYEPNPGAEDLRIRHTCRGEPHESGDRRCGGCRRSASAAATNESSEEPAGAVPVYPGMPWLQRDD